MVMPITALYHRTHTILQYVVLSVALGWRETQDPKTFPGLQDFRITPDSIVTLGSKRNFHEDRILRVGKNEASFSTDSFPTLSTHSPIDSGSSCGIPGIVNNGSSPTK
jgi:hypothetical protein